MTITETHNALQLRLASTGTAFQHADEMWGTALRKAFGRRAADARYSALGQGEPGTELRALYVARYQAYAAWSAARGLPLCPDPVASAAPAAPAMAPQPCQQQQAKAGDAYSETMRRIAERDRAKAAATGTTAAQRAAAKNARRRSPKSARGERRYVTVRDTETGDVHRVLTSVARVGVAVVIFTPSNRHRQGALGGMLITHDDIRKAWVFNDEAEARRMLSRNGAPGERVIRAELISDPAAA